MDITWYLVQPSPGLQIAIAIILNQIFLNFSFAQEHIASFHGVTVDTYLVRDSFTQVEWPPPSWRSHDRRNLRTQHT